MILLRTGEASTLLACSRQHVVDLCTRGDLPHVWVGKHRRVPREAVERLLHSGHELTRDQERSLWLHRALLADLLTDPDAMLTTARRNLARWADHHRPDGMTRHWLGQWQETLDQGVDAVAEVLTSRAPEAVELRQNSPFAGVLDQQVRARVLHAFVQHWRREHVSGRPAA